jgi:hypothetical protein
LPTHTHTHTHTHLAASSPGGAKGSGDGYAAHRIHELEQEVQECCKTNAKVEDWIVKMEAESDELQKELARAKGSLGKHASPLSGK